MAFFDYRSDAKAGQLEQAHPIWCHTLVKILLSMGFVLLSAVSLLADASSNGWEYKYKVAFRGLEHETVYNGALTFRGKDIPPKYEYVKTPIGEFVFVNERVDPEETRKWIPYGHMRKNLP